MVRDQTREHERIMINMPTRMWLSEKYKQKDVEFEGYAQTRDLAIGGTFLKSDYLLPIGCPLNLEMTINETELLLARGEIVHTITSHESHEPGMGVMFTELDGENRERLLRFFISDRIRAFYEERFLVEFPHMEEIMSLKDVALIVNLWEDKEGRLTSLRTPDSGKSRKKRRDEEIEATRRRGQN